MQRMKNVSMPRLCRRVEGVVLGSCVRFAVDATTGPSHKVTQPHAPPIRSVPCRRSANTSSSDADRCRPSSAQLRASTMIEDSQLHLSWPVIGAAVKMHLQWTQKTDLSDPSTFLFKVTNSLPSSSASNPKAFSERYITVFPTALPPSFPPFAFWV